MREPSAKRDSLSSELAFATFEAACIVARYRSVVIAVWIDETDALKLEDIELWLLELSRSYPDGLAFLQILGEEHPGFSPSAQLALKHLLRATKSCLREAPVVYEGSGFRAAFIRAVVTSIFTQRDRVSPHRVYSSVEDAAFAIGKGFERREPARYSRELCDALAAIRDRHHAEFPTASKSFIRYRG